MIVPCAHGDCNDGVGGYHFIQNRGEGHEKAGGSHILFIKNKVVTKIHQPEIYVGIIFFFEIGSLHQKYSQNCIIFSLKMHNVLTSEGEGGVNV